MKTTILVILHVHGHNFQSFLILIKIVHGLKFNISFQHFQFRLIVQSYHAPYLFVLLLSLLLITYGIKKLQNVVFQVFVNRCNVQSCHYIARIRDILQCVNE